MTYYMTVSYGKLSKNSSSPQKHKNQLFNHHFETVRDMAKL